MNSMLAFSCIHRLRKLLTRTHGRFLIALLNTWRKEWSRLHVKRGAIFVLATRVLLKLTFTRTLLYPVFCSPHVKLFKTNTVLDLNDLRPNSIKLAVARKAQVGLKKFVRQLSNRKILTFRAVETLWRTSARFMTLRHKGCTRIPKVMIGSSEGSTESPYVLSHNSYCLIYPLLSSHFVSLL